MDKDLEELSVYDTELAAGFDRLRRLIAQFLIPSDPNPFPRFHLFRRAR